MTYPCPGCGAVSQDHLEPNIAVCTAPECTVLQFDPTQADGGSILDIETAGRFLAPGFLDQLRAASQDSDSILTGHTGHLQSAGQLNTHCPDWIYIAARDALTHWCENPYDNYYCHHEPVSWRPQPVFEASWLLRHVTCAQCIPLLLDQVNLTHCDGCHQNYPDSPCVVIGTRIAAFTWLFRLCQQCMTTCQQETQPA